MKFLGFLLLAGSAVTLLGVAYSMLRASRADYAAAEAQRGIAELELYLREMSRD